MSIAPNDYLDRYGLDRTSQEMWGAKTEQEMGTRSLKQYNPVAAQYLNISPNTAPGPKKVAAPTVPKAPAPAAQQPKAQPAAPLQGSTPSPTSGRGFGPASGFGSEPGQAPATGVPSVRRGFGPHSGLVPPEEEAPHVQPMAPSTPAMLNQTARQALMRMAALPGASPTIILYARMVSQRRED